MKKSTQPRIASALPVAIALSIFLRATPLGAQHLEAPPGRQTTNEIYAPSVTPAIYLINFLFLYTANPDVAASLPAYRAPIPQPVVDCLVLNPTGCPYAMFKQYFEAPTIGAGGECFWPNVCQEEAKLERLTPRKARRLEQLNEPLGKQRAEQLARLLGITDDMILTGAEYRCMIGIPPRSDTRETIFRCVQNLTNSKGNALIPLSSYGLNITEQGDIRSVCATNAPCLNFNALLAGPLEEIAAECGFLEKLVRMQTQTPFLQLVGDADRCQKSAGTACFVETTCAGK